MRSIWNVQYMQRVLAIDPIAYWMMDEKQGLVSYDMVTARVAGAQNGVYTGATLGQPSIGDGQTCPLFDGINDQNDVFTAAFTAAFDGDEGSAFIWARVSGAGAWTDGVERRFLALQGAVSFLILRKDAAVNQLALIYSDSVGAKQEVFAATTTDWFSIGVTWSKTANETIYYFNGAKQGNTDPCAGWGAPLNNRALIGTGTPAFRVWDGWLAHCAFWDRPLTPAEITDLAVV